MGYTDRALTHWGNDDIINMTVTTGSEPTYTSYTYDVTGRRVGKTVNGSSTSYLWGGDHIAYETGEHTVSYSYGVRRIGISEGADQRYCLYNGHGDTVQLANGNGTIAEDYRYDAFGNQQEETEHTVYNPFRYSGEYMDEESGLTYLRNRYYDSAIGRFITEDPIRDGLNWYVYCNNTPVMFTDRSGLAAGDPFSDLDDAAIDFAQEYYSTTDYIMLELATLFYSYVDEDGNTWFSYVLPKIYEPHSVTSSELANDRPDGAITVGFGHAHPNGTDFSSSDLSAAESRYNSNNNIIASFVVAPGAKLLKYSTDGAIDDSGNTVWAKSTVSESLPLRGLSIAEKIALTQTYKSRWDNHLATCTGFGCSEKTWPRTKSGAAESWTADGSDFINNWLKSVLAKRFKI